MSARELELETVRVEQRDRVVIARLDDPPYNYMTARMQHDLDALTAAVDEDRSVGAVVVTGAPADRYITHFDIGDLLAAAEGTRRVSERTMGAIMRGIEVARGLPGAQAVLEASPVSGVLNLSRFNEVVLRIMRSPAVYIAAVNGPCGGGGLELSVCFDVRLSSDAEGVGFILPELLIGLTTTVGAQRLVQLIGPARALELLLEGRMYSPQEALAMGLIGRVVPGEELLDVAIELGARYATRNRDTIAAQKRIFSEHILRSPAASLRAEGATNAAGILSGVAPRALQAWVQLLQESGGDSLFLTDLEPWRRGEVIDLNPDD